jgi:hypothetical protein
VQSQPFDRASSALSGENGKELTTASCGRPVVDHVVRQIVQPEARHREAIPDLPTTSPASAATPRRETGTVRIGRDPNALAIWDAHSAGTCTSAWPSTTGCRSGFRRRSPATRRGSSFRRLAAEQGVVFPDHFDHDWRAGSREGAARDQDARARFTEIHLQGGDRHTRCVRGRDSRGPSLNECYANVWSCWLACKRPREWTVYVFSRHTATDELNLF